MFSTADLPCFSRWVCQQVVSLQQPSKTASCRPLRAVLVLVAVVVALSIALGVGLGVGLRGHAGPSPVAAQPVVMGVVLDATTGIAVAGCAVTGGSKTSTSSADGTFAVAASQSAPGLAFLSASDCASNTHHLLPRVAVMVFS